MATSKEAGEFNLIITDADTGANPDAARDLAEAFSLDEVIAGQIVSAAPIIFATKLTKTEVKAITPKLVELSRRGLGFRVTARVPNKVPKLHWPMRPQFTAGASAAPVGLAFQWDNNAFVCPSCGETFLFRRLGQLKLSEVAAEAPAAAAPAPAPAAAAPAPAPAAAPAPAPARASKAAKAQPARVEPVIEEATIDFADDVAPPEPASAKDSEPLPGEGESLDLPEAVEEINLDDAPAEKAEEPELKVEEEAAPAEGGEFTAAADEASAEQEPVPADGDLYNVFLSKINDKSKADKAAELISKTKGCSLQEAKELTSRLIIPIAKNVSKEQAEDILNNFKKIKIFGRMTKVK
jgi:ribosomal protein L7/L12